MPKSGSGKSELIRFIIEALPDVEEDDVVYTSFTGKATQVLSQKGNKNVMTLHKLLYESHPRPDGTFYRKPRREIGYHIVVVDEISMVPKSLIELLFHHKAYVICLGDPFQIPCIDKEDDNHLLDHPHVFLDEIIRQAQDSEIIRLSMAIRNYQPFAIEKYKDDVQILDKQNLSTGMLTWANQIIVATNKTRKNINDQVRRALGFTSPEPQEGEKVICNRNYWGKFSNLKNDLINGTIGYLQNKYDTSIHLPKYASGKIIDITVASLNVDEKEYYENLEIDTHMIQTGEKCISKALEYRLMKNPRTAHLVPYEFNYGYAITGHKAQGSQWEKVLVIEEGFPFDKEEHARWAYTSITRATSRLVLLR